jgi:hypothetical protein
MGSFTVEVGFAGAAGQFVEAGDKVTFKGFVLEVEGIIGKEFRMVL